MAYNKRSRSITAGVARSPSRAMLRAVGFGDGDFDKPIVGVANGHSTMNPCNAGIQPLAERAVAALEQAGAKPQIFGVPTVTDGIGMGTEAMKYSLVSREVIADAIETSVNGQAMDGVLVVGGCDKNMPGGMMAIARMNVPGIYVYAGTIKPGKWKGRTSRSCRRSRPSARTPPASLLKTTSSASKERLPERRRLRRHVHREHDELLVRGARHEPARLFADGLARRRKGGLRGAVGARDGAIKNDLKPRDIITRKSIENAIALVMATGGSTNAVLHYLAIAAAAGVKWTIDDFERMRRKVPVLCDLKPSGRFVAVDFHRAGGVPQVLKILLKEGVLHGGVHDHPWQDHGRHAERGARCPAPGSGRDPRVVQAALSRGPPRHSQGNLAPEGCVAKIWGSESGDDRAGARVRFGKRLHAGHHGEAHQARRRDRDRYEGPKGGPACRRCSRRPPP